MLFEAKQALVRESLKAMYQTTFLAHDKGLNFSRWLSDFESTTLDIS